MNVTGEAIDGIGTLDKKGGYPIHRKPPKYEDLSTEKEVFIPVLKLSTLLNHIQKEEKSVSSEVPVLEKQLLSLS